MACFMPMICHGSRLLGAMQERLQATEILGGPEKNHTNFNASPFCNRK